MHYTVPSLALVGLFSVCLAAAVAAPAPRLARDQEGVAARLDERQLGGLLSGLNGVLLGTINSAVAAKNSSSINSALVKIVPASRPTDIADAFGRQAKVWASPTGRTDIYAAIATQVASGLGPLLDGTLNTALTGGLPVGENSINNNNPPPSTTVYPKKDSGDAPYSLSEDTLRKAIYIPSSFSYGSGTKRPVIMVPGTGSYGGSNFANNLRKLLTGQSFADPVWLNIPGAMLGDAQLNSEYIAYAINYISAVSKSNKDNLAVISWSQGGLDAQWAFNYWPSTRKVVKDFLPVSPDFKGTVFANALCLSAGGGAGLGPCPPSVIQQEATSNYVKTLRSGGGDSAYVPTTTFYSGFFDEIVEPQQGTGASAYLPSGNAASNNYEVQQVCAGHLGSGFYGHAGVLFHPLTAALVFDALKNDGPGSLDRIDISSVCNNLAAPGLDLDDILATSGLIPIAAVLLLSYPDRRLVEPELMPYAS